MKMTTLSLYCTGVIVAMLTCLMMSKHNVFAADNHTCATDSAKQEAMSNELQMLMAEDQKDRENAYHPTNNEMAKMTQQDHKRRDRVDVMFRSGCFKTASDYYAAALIYQHGGETRYYYQAHQWAKQAMALGDANARQLAMVALDRYLISIGKKQIFGSQVALVNQCYCMLPVEESISNDIRRKYAASALHDRYRWLASINKDNHCSNRECGFGRVN